MEREKGNRTRIDRLLSDVEIHSIILLKLFLKWNVGLDIKL